MVKSINSSLFRKMFALGASALEENKHHVDALNVFPVPDGDTGTNMSLTINSSAKSLNSCFDNSWNEIWNAVSTGALKGARGNSGVILSQILKGMSLVLSKVENEITTKIFAKSLVSATTVAYKAVTKPKEGTILTVIRGLAESATNHAKKVSDFIEFFNLIMTDGEEVLQQTPQMLPVLQKAGVIDAGGRGLLVIFAGMQKAITGDEQEINVEKMDNSAGDFDVTDHIIHEHESVANLDNLGDIEFGYCTEFMVTHMKKKTTESDIDKLREKLVELGDSVVCVGDLDLVKVHVHTNEPNIALGYALELGELINLKIDNMVEQNREIKRKREEELAPSKEFGMVAVAPGVGIANVFRDILVDNIIEGGQTMNPSANDIAKACDMVPAKNIFVFPNNKNIILAAEQAKNLTKRNLHVIPTKTIPEGVSSVLSFNPDASLKENLSTLLSAKDNVISASVTYAVRKTNINDIELEEGDIIGLDENTILSKGSDINATTEDLIEKLINEDIVNITIFYGSEINEEQANSLQEKLQTKYSNCDVILIEGAQPVYYYIISME